MPDFPQHLLRETKGTMSPARLLFYDCETSWTDEGVFQYHTMKIGWTYYVRRDLHEDLSGGVWVFHNSQKDINRYIESLYQAKTNLYIIGHNVFFDLQSSGFFRYFAVWGYKLSFVYDSGLTYILVIKKGDFTIKVISTTNYFTESLERMGKAFGMEKSTIDFQSSSESELKEYCKQDVKILIEVMRRWFIFIKEHNCGSFGLTRAAQSFKAYQHRFMPEGLTIHQDETVVKLEREAYMGGRNEAFKLGKVDAKKIYCYDVNSMYPSIMRNQEFPYQLIDYLEYPYMKNLPFIMKNFAVVAEILVDSDEACYAVRYKDKLIFPVGVFRCFVTTTGLKYALEHGHLKQCYRIAVYEKMNLFKEYVDYFYHLKVDAKKSGDFAVEKMVKVFLNSLYGKFGQKKKIQVIEPDNTDTDYFRIDTLDIETMQMETETFMFGSVLRETGEVNGDNSMVSISAHITEYGRFILHNAIKGVGMGNILYVDTDSIYTSQEQLSSSLFHIDQHELGAWGLENEYKKMHIYGCKDYTVDNEVKIKGVPKTAKEVRPGVFEYLQFAGPATHLRAQESEKYIVRRITKTNKREYTKGIVGLRGNATSFTMIGDDLIDG